MDALVFVPNALIVGVVVLIWVTWKMARYKILRTKRALIELSLGLIGFAGIFDLAYYFHSRPFGKTSIIFLFVMLFFSVGDANKAFPRVLTFESKKTCKEITLKSILFSGGHSCLIELSRRTSVDFALVVYYLLIVAFNIPVISAFLYILFWYTGAIMLLWFPIPTVLGFSLITSAMAMAPLVYMMRKNLLKIRAKELSESKLP